MHKDTKNRRSTDSFFMRKALALSQKAEGKAEPGPLVGSLLVRNGRVLKEAYYKSNGGTHSEQQLLASGSIPKDSVLYVTLEPCVEFAGKRTPSCAQKIVESGIRNVIIAMKDPNPKVNGRGIELLKKNNISVSVGICNEEATHVNRVYCKYVNRKVPYVIAKWAMSLDGKISTHTGESKWITSEESRAYARSLRSKCQAVLVGIETVLKDNSRMIETTRVIMDSNARLPPDSFVAKTARKVATYIATTVRAPKAKLAVLEKKGVNAIVLKTLSFNSLLARLYDKGFSKVMIEGGGEVLGSAFEERCVDEIYAFVANKLIGGRDAKTPLEGKGVSFIADAMELDRTEVRQIGNDLLIHSYVKS